ncbi:50S ribosomal protein L2 [Candidatus Woesearchaeota archaeon]|nr:50S ribosomal protein L2 [Candidatus Woesearchaeota archaeon]
MGKRIITQRRGRGTFTYKAHSHRSKGKISNRIFDDSERNGIIEGRVLDIMHCSQHSAPLVLVGYGKSEVIMPAVHGIRMNDEVKIGFGSEIKKGNIMQLKDIPEGTDVCNIEASIGKPAFCRAAGSFAKIIGKQHDKVILKMPSKKEREFDQNCRAMIGIVAGSGRRERPFMKAGNRHHLMRAKGKLYPRTSGVAMNAVDHPFGSGRGRHVGKSKVPPRNAPPGRNIGLLAARRTGRKR